MKRLHVHVAVEDLSISINAGEFAGHTPGRPPGVSLAVEIFDSSHWIPSDRPDELAALLRARLALRARGDVG